MSQEAGPRQAAGLQSWPATALLDALPDAVAVLDHTGTIVAVNRAWRMFTLDNGGDPASTGVGVNYLQVCSRSAAAGSRDAAAVAAGLTEVLNGSTVERDVEYACPSPQVGRWFVMRITPISGPRPGALVSHVDITRQRQAERSLEDRPAEDPLTDLLNRTAFHERLGAELRARRDRGPGVDVGLVAVNLDGFRAVNDGYGRAAGDAVLQTVASRLQRATRPHDSVARMRGDEFAVLIPRTTFSELTLIAQQIERALARPHLVHGRRIEIAATVATYLASVADTPAHALERTDEALFLAKRARRL